MNKVIVLDTRQGGDWSLDLLFAGLVQCLGANRVFDAPVKEKHRQGKIILTGDHEKDWGAERKSLGYTPSNNLVSGNSEMYQALKRGEISHIFLDERDESYQLYRSMQLHLFDVKVVVVAGHDRFWNESVEKLRTLYGRKLQMVFADNLLPNIYHTADPLVKPHTWAANFDHLAPSGLGELRKNKVYDLCFMGYNSHGSRDRYLTHIKQKWGHLNNHIVLETQANTFNAFVPKSEYFKKIAQSRVCLNFRGAAVNGKALRFLEIPYVGSCMLAEKTDWVLEEQWTEGAELEYFRDIDELDMKIEFLLYNPVFRENIAQRGHEYLLRRHTTWHRTQEMLEALDGQARAVR